MKTFIYIFIFVLVVGSPLLAFILLNNKKYKCDNSTGSCKQDSSGKYTTLKECQNACVPPKRYECQKNESGNFSECIENSSGKYLYECQSDCGNYITFYFEDGTTEKFPYSIKLTYFTKRGVQNGCYDKFKKGKDENIMFKMKNDNPPIKFNTTSIQPPGWVLHMCGYNWNFDPFLHRNRLCNEYDIELQPGQDLKDLGPSPGMSSKIWTNSFNYFMTAIDVN
jgi:hypothetical protein